MLLIPKGDVRALAVALEVDGEALEAIERAVRWSRAAQAVVARLTTALTEHPAGWDGPCGCAECRNGAT